MNAKKIDKLLKQNPREIDDIEQWASQLRQLGYSFRLPVGDRMQRTIKKHGVTYHLIEADRERRISGLPEPCFMGNDGFALRTITR